ncbi:hypothetical protein F5887DRAFT_1167975 [Amanita rubescens]|nr:hypothetical protein F5887DRAFT_1167975 [Amanita rubescens]
MTVRHTPELPNPSIPSEITITPELKSAFLSSLEERGISLRFFARSWEAFDLTNTPPPQGYDIVLTSETIYRTETLPSSSPCYARLVVLRITDAPKWCTLAMVEEYLALKMNGSRGKLGNVETVWEKKTGVKRKSLVIWPAEPTSACHSMLSAPPKSTLCPFSSRFYHERVPEPTRAQPTKEGSLCFKRITFDQITVPLNITFSAFQEFLDNLLP